MRLGWLRVRSALDVALPILLALCILRLWLMPLGAGFWIDEMATVFVVQHGAADPSLAAAPQVPYSAYYWLPRAAQALFGSSEVVYRLPSVLAMAIAIALIAKLGARLIHPSAAWFAVFACLALAPFNYLAADARPYGLGVCIAAAGVLTLVRWFDFGHWRDGLLFVFLGALLWRVHLIFWPFYLVFAGYALARLGAGKTRAGWVRTAALFAVIGISLAPVLVDALALQRSAGAHVIVKPPSFHEFEHTLRWNYVLAFGIGAWLVARALKALGAKALLGAGDRDPGAGALAAVSAPDFSPSDKLSAGLPVSKSSLPGAPGPDSWPPKEPKTGISRSALGLILAWWLCPPVSLYVYSLATGQSVYVRRYYSLMLAGTALAATAAAARSIPPTRWKSMAALLGLGALVCLGQWNRVWPWHERSDWRAAAQAVNASLLDSETPVICPSPFVEGRPPIWRPDYHMPGFLYSHLPVYPIRGRVYLFPFVTTDEAAQRISVAPPDLDQYAAGLTRDALVRSRRFMVYGGNGAVRFWRKWFLARPELAGWRMNRRYYGDVELATFDAPAR